MASTIKLRRVRPADVAAERYDPVDPAARESAAAIVKDVQEKGTEGMLAHAVRLGDLKEGQPHVLDRAALKKAFDNIPQDQQELLLRTAQRIKTFAEAQRNSISELSIPVMGGKAGHNVDAVENAGCYAPGGRYPLPSSVLMTAVTARAAGVKNVWVASPRPAEITKAAAYVSNADGLLAVGGAQAIAALAFGTGGVPACDSIVGPGNRWVTAAKQLVAGRVSIDMLAGPSELLVFADHSADPSVVASDLLAQAEHDIVAVPTLVTTDEFLVAKVEAELEAQLKELPTRDTAARALQNGFVVVVKDIEEGIAVSDEIAAEHLELLLENADDVAKRVKNYGGLFIGSHTAEVFGDYGIGPNHTLPTGGTSRSSGGLSVFSFLRIRTWIRIESLPKAQQVVKDSAALARLEGLMGHAKSAEQRLLPEGAQKSGSNGIAAEKV